MVSPASEGSSPNNSPEGSSPVPQKGGEHGMLDQPALPVSRTIAHSARQHLKDLFSGMIEQILPERVHVYEPSVHNHITLVLMSNLSSGNLGEALQLSENEMRTAGHRYKHAHQITLILDCCTSMEGNPAMSASLSDLYITLGDQILFLQGMFKVRDIDRAVDLNYSQLPRSVRNLYDVGEFAYNRASQLVAENPEDSLAEQRSLTLELLGDRVIDCARGLRFVRQELDALPYELRSYNPLLFFEAGGKVA